MRDKRIELFADKGERLACDIIADMAKVSSCEFEKACKWNDQHLLCQVIQSIHIQIYSIISYFSELILLRWVSDQGRC